MPLIVGIAAFGILYSIFLGIFANRIFSFEGRKPNYTAESAPGWSRRVFQFWFNFVCSLIGWSIAIHYLWRFFADPSQFSFKTDDAVPLLILLLGVPGLLPRTLFYGVRTLDWFKDKD
ncbi:MAG: hypothetical protein WA741_26685 [Candidatus Sulfotelmatobacter sp.]